MKKERNTKKWLNDLYFYLDYLNGFGMKSKENEERYENIKEKYENKFNTTFPNELEEYYGLFTRNGRACVDSKRYNKFFKLDDKILKIMNNRNSTYYHPTKKSYGEYYVHMFVDEINQIIDDYNKKYKKIINNAIKNIKKPEKVYPGDYYNLQCGISGINGASMWANSKNYENEMLYKCEVYETTNTLYAQFFHQMVSRIEAVTIKVYSSVISDFKKFTRDKLYDNVNTKKISSRTLPSFKYHDMMYSIWNFIKHNNMNTYQTVYDNYKECLIDCEYVQGDLAIHYLKLDEKFIIDLLNGTKRFFIEWCELNLNEVYDRALWDYDSWFIEKVQDQIEIIANPLGLSIFDEMD